MVSRSRKVSYTCRHDNGLVGLKVKRDEERKQYLTMSDLEMERSGAVRKTIADKIQFVVRNWNLQAHEFKLTLKT